MQCKRLLTLSLVLLFCLCTADQTKAAEQPKILVMGEDADDDSVPRHNRIFNRVVAALQSSMQELGFDVFEETPVAMDVTNPKRVRRADSELIAVARAIQSPPIDVVAVFQIFAAAQANPYADIKQLQVRIAGRLIQVQSGRNLGNFEVSVGPKGLRPLPPQCNRDCILERVGDEAKIVAKEVGLVLARKLDERAPGGTYSGVTNPITQAPAGVEPNITSQKHAGNCQAMSTAYTIVLQGYEGADLQAIEGMLSAFQGYEHHRPIRTALGYSEYWYETCSDRARLERNIRLLTEQLAGQNRMAMTGNKIEIQRIPANRQR